MDTNPDRTESRSWIGRLWHRLTTPSARWSVLALVVIGLLVGAGGVIGTQVMVAATGTNAFCSTYSQPANEAITLENIVNATR